MASYKVVMLMVVVISGNSENNSLDERNVFGNDSLSLTTKATPLSTHQYTVAATPNSGSNLTERTSCSDQTTTAITQISIIDTGSMSKETFQSFEIVVRYLQFFLIGLGIVANICNIAVFSQQNMTSATSTILIFLSSSELGFVVCELIVSSAATSMGSDAYTSELYWTLIRWVRVYMTTVFQKNAFSYNLFVALERCIAVSFPLKAKQILRRKNPVIFCTGLFLVILIFHIFNPLKMEVVSIKTGHDYIHVIRNSHFFTEYPEIFESFTLTAKILFVYVPLFGCLVMNILMVIALKRHSRNRKSLQVNQGHQQQQKTRHEVQTTVTILVSSFLFAIFSLPITTVSIVQSVNPDYGSQKKEHYLYTFMMYFSGFLALLSLSFDFIVYMILSTAFRQTFLDIVSSVRSSICYFCHKHRSSMDMPGPFVVLNEIDSYSMTVQQEIDTRFDCS